MKDLSKAIKQDLIHNSFEILRDYVESVEVDTNKTVLDPNIGLLKDYFLAETKKDLGRKYSEYIETSIIYAFPGRVSADIVRVPKNLTGLRDYRYMAPFGHVLYGSVALLFANTCLPLLSDMNLRQRKIYSYYPSKLSKSKQGNWQANKTYKADYADFCEQVKDNTAIGDIVLSIDIAKYFDSIDHTILLEFLDHYSTETARIDAGINQDTKAALSFYLSFLMRDTKGIPQGRKSFASDFLGHIYLVPFDFEVETIARTENLSFKAMIRYVDDIKIVLQSKSKSIIDIQKEVFDIEQKISGWLSAKLGLSLNPQKTIKKILASEEIYTEFIEDTIKNVSGSSLYEAKSTSQGYPAALAALSKYRFDAKGSDLHHAVFPKEREKIKYVFDKAFKKTINRKQHRQELLKVLDSLNLEVCADDFHIILPYFTKLDDIEITEKLILKLISSIQDHADKRFIHMLVIAFNSITNHAAQVIEGIRDIKEILIDDDYGKYLALVIGEYDPTVQNETYQEICEEFLLGNGNYLVANTRTVYRTAILNFKRDRKLYSDASRQSLALLAHEEAFMRWGPAFNQLQSFFHELCKCIYLPKGGPDKLGDVISSIKDLGTLSPEEELLLRKFYSKRNSSNASHAGHKGVPGRSIEKDEFNDYKNSIFRLINKLFDPSQLKLIEEKKSEQLDAGELTPLAMGDVETLPT